MPRISYDNKKMGSKRLEMVAVANQILEEYATQGYDLTLRQLYYQFVARDILPNTGKSYDLLGGVINDARMTGLVDWDYIVDRTRFLRDLDHWENPAEAIKDWAKRYFGIDRWSNQSVRPEVWIEKDALVGVIQGVCNQMDTGYFSCRGYVSQSEMWAAGNRIRGYMEAGQRVVLFHLGDHDPSGIDMTRDIKERLDTFICGDHWRLNPDLTHDQMVRWMDDNFEVRRIALTSDQIEEFNPPPNPAKLSDSRATEYIARYGDSSWELDALEPTMMSDLILGSIWDIMDEDLWAESAHVEEHHLAELQLASDNWSDISKMLKKIKPKDKS